MSTNAMKDEDLIKRLQELVTLQAGRIDKLERENGDLASQRDKALQGKWDGGAPLEFPMPIMNMGPQGEIVNFRQHVIDTMLQQLDPETLGLDGLSGMDEAKDILRNAIIHPLLFPKVFSGARASRKKVLLYGPPGCGKTLIAKAVAKDSGATLFYVTLGRISSKYRGESEKIVEALFKAGHEYQPCIIVIDEIDAFLPDRETLDNEAALKEVSSMMTELEGLLSSPKENIFVIAATNRPFAMDSGERRRFKELVFVDLPDQVDRKKQMIEFFASHQHRVSVTDAEFGRLALMTEGYSRDDVAQVCKAAAARQIQSLSRKHLERLENAPNVEELLPPISVQYFLAAKIQCKPTTTVEEVNRLRDFAQGKEVDVKMEMAEKLEKLKKGKKRSGAKPKYHPRLPAKNRPPGCGCSDPECEDRVAPSAKPPSKAKAKSMGLGRKLFEALRGVNPFANSTKEKKEWARKYYLQWCRDPSSAPQELYPDFKWFCDLYGEEALRVYCQKKGDAV